jgi:alanine racemase
MGSEVTLWGQATAGALLPIDEVAAAAGTVGYELMCALARRVPVQTVDGDNGAADLLPAPQS